MASNSSQSTSLFGDDPDGFEDTLREIDLNLKGHATSTPSAPSPPAKLIPQKRHREELSQPEPDLQSTNNEPNEERRENEDVDIRGLASIRQRNDPKDIYGPSSFGDYGEYMSRKRAKLQIQNAEMTDVRSDIFKGVEIYVSHSKT
jgi:DNA repair protein REV1